jgi:hypothetical protein
MHHACARRSFKPEKHAERLRGLGDSSGDENGSDAMKRDWEIIADNLSKAGWSLGLPLSRGFQRDALSDYDCDFGAAIRNTDLMNFIFTKNIGILLLAIYLIVIGLSTISGLAIPGVITGVLALAAGIFILIGR